MTPTPPWPPSPDSLRGRLLVAAPPLVDPNFDRTVILLLEHGEDGALGIVLNRPSPLDLDDALPDWASVGSAPAVVFVGGPVSPEAVIALGRSGAPVDDESWIPVLEGVGTVDVGRDPEVLGPPLDAFRVFVGYAGWAPGQLEGEIESGGWFVVPALPADPFTDDPLTMWRDVLRRQRGGLAMFAHCPTDPSVN